MSARHIAQAILLSLILLCGSVQIRARDPVAWFNVQIYSNALLVQIAGSSTDARFPLSVCD